nr:SIR2 family protein [Burkholderia diffusa]
MQFSNDGPAFPYTLVDAMLAGDVVFLCGAGVSAPQLPMFGALVEKVYPRVGLEPTPAELATIEARRYEEVLGAISRRLANPSRLYEAVTDLLTLPVADTAHHKTLLRLSRDRDNRVVLVTTNFEGLFERALDELEGQGSGQRASLAGQALPPPGTQACHGVIHLHGRIADTSCGLEVTPIVLTSAEYGDAYMRSGWASRFLFDLVRCKTLVLVGYSASDAPVRYFLNLLEGDRDRFTDLQTVYALDAYKTDPSETTAKWETIAVTPLGFRAGNGDDPYAALWRDLGRLADLVEQPATARRARCMALLQKAFADTSESERDEVEWLMRGKGDLWPPATGWISDPAWFAHFDAARLWPDANGMHIVANWCCQKPVDRSRLETAIGWHSRYGQPFAHELEQRLVLSIEKMPRPWAQAWRALIRTVPTCVDVVMYHYRLAQALQSPLVDDYDLRRAIEAITPRIQLRARNWFDGVEGALADAKSVRDIVAVSLTLDDHGDSSQLCTALGEVLNRDRRLARLCTEALITVGTASQEIGLVTEDWDSLDYGVPSVEDHDQNEYHDGAVHLCVVLTGLFSRLALVDREYARALARAWTEIPGVLGQRLWVHALRDARLFSDDEAAEGVLEVPRIAFWSMRRELVLTMQARLRGVSRSLVEKIVKRILDESPLLYSEYAPEEGVDWREQARDHRVWLLLTAIRQAGALTKGGQDVLSAIHMRHAFLDRDYEDADLFESYSSGVLSVQGDATPLLEADAEQRLDIARTQRSAPDFTSRLSWSAYCSAQPTAAFQALVDAELDQKNAGLWLDLLQALASATVVVSDRNETADALVPRVFARLADATEDWLAEQLSPLSYLLRRYADHQGDYDAVGVWWDRLWKLAELHEPPVSEDVSERFYDRVINRPSGRLVEWLLTSMDQRMGKAGVIERDRQRVRDVIASDTAAGWLGRGVCARNAGFVLRVDFALACGPFRTRLCNDELEGASLRATLLGGVQLDEIGTRVYKRALFRAICETSKADSGGPLFASKILYPLVNWRTRPRAGRPPLSAFEVRRLLTRAPHAVLAGVANVLKLWVGQLPGGRAYAWTTFIGPVLESIWPNDVRFKRASVAKELAELCVSAGTSFEQAFDAVRHFLTPLEGDVNSVSFLHQSEAVTSFPASCLELMWLLCGPGASGRPRGLSEVLIQIGHAEPGLTVDRRFQWLEQNRVVRYE